MSAHLLVGADVRLSLPLFGQQDAWSPPARIVLAQDGTWTCLLHPEFRGSSVPPVYANVHDAKQIRPEGAR